MKCATAVTKTKNTQSWGESTRKPFAQWDASAWLSWHLALLDNHDVLF